MSCNCNCNRHKIDFDVLIYNEDEIYLNIELAEAHLEFTLNKEEFGDLVDLVIEQWNKNFCDD